MAINRFSDIGHVAIIAQGTHQEVLDFLAALPSADRIEAGLTGVEVLVTDKPGQENWRVTPTTIVPLVTIGTMSGFTVKGGTGSELVDDAGTVEFAGSSVIGTAVTVGANGEKVVTTTVKGEVADAGKIVKLDSAGVAQFVAETFGSKEDTLSIALSLAAGKLTADAKVDVAKGLAIGTEGIGVALDPNASNDLSFEEGLLYSKKYTVKAGSEASLAIDAATNEIEFIKLDDQGEWFETSHSSIADYVGSTDPATHKIGKGDRVKFVNAIGKIEVWVARVDSPSSVSDYIQTTGVDTTDAIIRSAIESGAGWSFNKTSGVGAAKLRAIATGKRNDLALDGTDLFVDALAAESEIGFGSQDLQSNLVDLYGYAGKAVNRTYNSGLTKTVDVATGAETVTFGGDLLANTTLTALDKTMEFSATTGSYNFTTNNVNFKDYFTLISAGGEVLDVYANSLRTLKTRVHSPNLLP